MHIESVEDIGVGTPTPIMVEQSKKEESEEPRFYMLDRTDKEYARPKTQKFDDEAGLEEIVKLVGMDALSADDRITLEIARSIREDFLQQNAFEDVDWYTPLPKQYKMLELLFSFEDKARRAVESGADVEDIATLDVRERIARFKSVPDDRYVLEAERVSEDHE